MPQMLNAHLGIRTQPFTLSSFRHLQRGGKRPCASVLDVPTQPKPLRNLMSMKLSEHYLKQVSRGNAHPAGVRGVGCLALISAFVGPRRPVDAAILTAIRIIYPMTLVTRSVIGGSEVLTSFASRSMACPATECCMTAALYNSINKIIPVY